MAVHKVTKGLDIPISGVPEQVIADAPPVSRVAVLARDFNGLKARVLVEPGDQVRLGQALLEHREHAAIRLVSPGSGRVEAVHRGDKRALQSVVIALDADSRSAVDFAAYAPNAGEGRASAKALLLESGLWTALRTRPFSRIPSPDDTPRSIFVTALDTQPLALDVDVALRGREAEFARGLAVLKQLTDGPVFLCRRPGSSLGGAPGSVPGVRLEEFTGKHPAGTVGYHIHVLDPVHREKTVWHIGAQDVARIGHLFDTGQLDPTLVIAVGGPQVAKPRVLRTRLGASTVELTSGQLRDGHSRVVSGSVLTGDRADDAVHGFLGRFHQQISVLAEGGAREFLGWMAPGAGSFSSFPAFLSSVLPRKQFALDTGMHGSRRAMVPIGAYERVMPMDILPTHLLRALTVGDLEWAEELGVLELDEEDLALCAFVCPGKYEHGAALRRALTAIAAEH
ncbi:MAG: Na(+)-translocating NADH-quinone reductase subunit A [Gemmatimonadaceae bacterium]|nr:Na(+)-translocating NADH-quinone reductase subunit A [Gemmatimonadaceae bacterium]